MNDKQYVIDKKENFIVNTGAISEGYGYAMRSLNDISMIMTNDFNLIVFLRTNHIKCNNMDELNKLIKNRYEFYTFNNDLKNVPKFEYYIEFIFENENLITHCYYKDHFQKYFNRTFVKNLYIDDNLRQIEKINTKINNNKDIYFDYYGEYDDDDYYKEYDVELFSEEGIITKNGHPYLDDNSCNYYYEMDEVEMIMDNYFEGLFKYKDSYILTDVCKQYNSVYKLKILKTLNKEEYEKRHKNCMNILHDIEELLVTYGYYGIGDTIKLCMDYEKTLNIILNEDINVTDNYFLYIGDSIKFDINDIQEIIIDKGIIGIENENISVEIKIFEEE